ncbi:hypothetical protein SAMD00024442_2_69 [Candidatus Symbiothrix dinenymphae]|nr:hypothetical protein SAMD00024442_2_69 [Candidatus Symbiothrix dinenymphae]
MSKREFIRLGVMLCMVLCVVLCGCSSPKNTAGTRWYHAFNTRYNVYFNGEMAYDEALKKQTESYQDNYSDILLMYPVDALPREKATQGGAFDRAIEKGVKAAKQHSIRTKPKANPGRRNDPAYKAWRSRMEFNAFLFNAWMLVGKGQFHNGDFMLAGGTFAYIARIYDTQPEIGVDALIWQARSYTNLGWFYEAEDILLRVKREGIPNKRLEHWYAATYADFWLQQKQYADVIPYLQKAIDAEKNSLQRNRERYLLGQLYAKEGNKALAYKAFSEIQMSKVPYSLQFSTKIRQSEVMEGSDTTHITKQLRKMAKDSKNKDYLDQIYYALGNVYMGVPDTATAIAHYELGVETSTQNGFDKTLNQLILGDLYFQQRNYAKAHPHYTGALAQLAKEHEAYPRVEKRTEILGELVVVAEAVNLQDSLQRLAKMTDSERLKVVNKLIDDLKQKEKEEELAALREAYENTLDETRSQLTQLNKPVAAVVAPTKPGEENLFYFYNTQAVALGKTAFQQKWGNRKLEDNWRRRNKTTPMGNMFAEEKTAEDTDLPEDSIANLPTDSLGNSLATSKPDSLSTDPHDPQFYLQQIPLTEEAIAASDQILKDGLYNMAVIYKNKLEDSHLAVETFNRLNTQFPEHEKKLDAYYNVYLIHLRNDNKELADRQKQLIREEFPESELAQAMADPGYEYNLKMMYVLQDSLYEATYEAYLEGDIAEIHQNYETVQAKYPQSDLMPKFAFLNALSYVQTHDAVTFKALLQEIIAKYPAADVTELAQEMMKRFLAGLTLSSSGDNQLARGGLLGSRWGAVQDVSAADSLMFSEKKDTPHLLMIVYSNGSLDDNLLLYTVASFNFGNFTVNDFDLEQTSTGEVNTLQIKSFVNLEVVQEYEQMIHEEEGYAAELERLGAIIVPISEANYNILLQGKTLEEYLQFYKTLTAPEN